MSYGTGVDQWDKDWQPPNIQNVMHQEIIEELARAEKFGMRRQEQIDHTVKALNLLEERLDNLKKTQRIEKLRAKDGRCSGLSVRR